MKRPYADVDSNVVRDGVEKVLLAAFATLVVGFVGYLLTREVGPPVVPDGRTATDLAVTPAAAEADGPEETEDETTLWVGDSLIEGSPVGGGATGGVGDANFSALVSDYYGWDLQQDAETGTGYLATPTIGAPDRVAEAAEAGYDTVFLVNGARDLDPVKHPDLADELPAAAGAAYDAWREALPDARIVVVGYVTTAPPTERLQRANEILREEAEERGFLWVDPTRWFASPSVLKVVGPDKIHATDEGHRYLASRVAKAIEALDVESWPPTVKN